MLDKVRQFVKKNKMIEPLDTVVVGVSGGADSVCLLLMLLELQKSMEFSIVAVHVNHCIRGKEANQDQEFVRNLCERLHVEYRVFTVEVEKIAQEEKLSVEEAGRKVRYRVFNEVLAETASRNDGRIAVAHHMDDQSETILMNVLRGSGIKGVCGMQPVSQKVIRPLLCVRRHEIEEYLADLGQTFQTDSTNLDNEYTRNRLRNVVFPYLCENVNLHSVENICGMAEMVSEAESYIAQQALIAKNQCVRLEENRTYKVDIKLFSEHASILKKYIIRAIIGELAEHLRDVYKIHIESVLELENKQVGSQVDLPYGIRAERGYSNLIIQRKSDRAEYQYENEPKSVIAGETVTAVVLDGEYYMKEKGFVHLENAEVQKIDKIQKIIGNDYTKVFDYDKINFTLQFRTRKTGDYIQIDNKSGCKKLKDFFIDQKVPKDYRDSVLLLADGSHIVWIVGYRMSEGYKITDKTKNVLQMTIY